MNYEELDEIGAWLNSKGYDIDLKDDFWMEDYRFSENKVRDVAELILDYHQEKVKNLTLPRVMLSLPIVLQLYRNAKTMGYKEYSEWVKSRLIGNEA